MKTAREILKRYYGYSDFREGQEKIINDVLQGKDTVGIMPTGGGKSACFQIPALMFSGLTIVLSPLISLMKDQVDSLNALGIKAAFINSSLTPQEVRNRIYTASKGQLKLLYIAPERIESAAFRSLCHSLPVSMVAVDEAHCISQWGHDFRPSYLSIAELIKELPVRPVVSAFTATATETVVKDIVRQLALSNPEIHVTGFDRKNLSFNVVRGEDKRDFVLRYLKANGDSAGIIYAATRKEVDNLYAFLRAKGFAVGKYHAGLNDSERAATQDAFLYDDIRVMAATNAFGMGIDKSNIRFVIHYNMPKNMEAYYQEAGRAGRDGEPSECILLFNPQDIQIQRYLLEQTGLSEERKAGEYHKLQVMVDYCHTPNCLRQYILTYFGEKNAPGACGNCGNCNDGRELKDITIVAQKVFSCILRLREMFGITIVAEVLKGSANKKVLRYQNLSVYGLLKEYNLKHITDLIKVLAADGYIRLTEGQYPIAKITPKAFAVLKNEQKVYQKTEPVRQSPVDNSLFELLRILRRDISHREQIPPYVVFPDSTLREMSQRLPLDKRSLLAIGGVGEVKLNKFGSDFLEVIRKYCLEREGSSCSDDAQLPGRNRKIAEGSEKEIIGKTVLDKEKIPSYLITFNLYKTGKSLNLIATERGLSLITVQGHLIQSADAGLEIDWEPFIPSGFEEAILAAARELGSERLRPIKEALPKEIDFFAIRAVIQKHKDKP